MDRSIVVSELVKTFSVIEKKPGLVGSVSSLISPKRKVVTALGGISFSISAGELVGFIGPNGAGKTTTLKILSGILYPSSGYVQVTGYTPWERNPKYLSQMSLVMGQKNQLWWDLPASESFELNRAIYQIPKKKYERNLKELTDILEVSDLVSIQVRRLSLGQRMRLELVAALLHEPKVIFLDEPTIGLDVVAQQKMRDFVSKYNRTHEATIVLTSHNMDDVASLAKRVIVISSGEVIFDGKLTELVERYASEKIITIHANKEVDYKKLEKVGEIIHIDLPLVKIRVPRSASKFAASELIQSFPIDDLTIEEESLDSIIGRVFRGDGKAHKRKIPANT